jgi:hypothetical protein
MKNVNTEYDPLLHNCSKARGAPCHIKGMV